MTSYAQPAGSVRFESPPALQRLIMEGIENNREIVALQRQINGKRQELRSAGAWEDPVVGLGLLNVPVGTWDLDQEAMTQKQISISQRIPWFGKSDLKTRRMALDVMRLETMLYAEKLDLVRELTQAYYQLGYIAESEAINQAMIAKVTEMIRIAETTYATGGGLQQDVLQAQVEQSRLMDTRISLETQRRLLEDRIQALLNRENVLAPAPPPSLTELPPPAIESVPWIEISLARSPDLMVRRIEADAADVEVSLARKAYWPDPNIQVAYGQREDDFAGNGRDDFISAGISFSVPLWSRGKQNAQLEAALEHRKAAAARVEDVVTRLPHQVDAIMAELRQLRDTRNLYRTAIQVQAEQWAQSAMSAYRVGKLDFNTMINAHLRLLSLQRQSLGYVYRYYQKLGELNQLTGGGFLEAGTVNGNTAVLPQSK